MTQIHDLLPWLEKGWTELNKYILQKRIPQALLITGNHGIGKQQLAEFYAQTLLCSSILPTGLFCGLCQSCKLFQAETHPDYISLTVDEPGKVIGISVIRQLITKLSLKPQFEGNRVVIINPADSLNKASANAFLKYLEEPTERTSLVLITDKPSKLPATIVSRCQKLVLSIPDKSVIYEWLKQEGVTEQRELLLSLSRNSPLLAKKLADTNLLKLRTACFNNWIKVGATETDFVEIAEQWCKFDKTEIDLLIFWIISWVIDMIKIAYNIDKKAFFNPDLSLDLKQLVHKLDLKNLFKYYDFLVHSHKRLDTQLNKQLMFEEVLIKWLQLNSR